MPWIYSQSTGALTPPGAVKPACYGFAGNGKGLNNPDFQHVRNVGPIPAGLYRMVDFQQSYPPGDGRAHMGIGVIALAKEPETNTFGRDGFYIHGYNPMNPLASSRGCPCLGTLELRRRMWTEGDRLLRVVA